MRDATTRMNKPRGTLLHTTAAVALGLVLATPAAPLAHEIPSDVTLQVFVKPEGDVLRLLLRVPLEAMRDVEFPTTGPGYLDLANAGRSLGDAASLWIAGFVDIHENGAPLGAGRLVAARASLPSNRSFATYDEALSHVLGPALPTDARIPWQQAMLDVLLEYTIQSDESEFAIDPRWARLGLRTVTALRFLPRDRVERAFRYSGDPGLVRLDPRWHQAAFRFIELGFLHILDGIDHLLFLLCLVVPVRRVRPLIPIVTSFTVAHSITLIASATGLTPDTLWFPPLIETLIAFSVLYMALENIVGAGLERRWIIAFGFGLVHGFGFSFALAETFQFAGAHLLTSLLSFNVGVELGQLLVLVLVIPSLELVFRHAVAERVGVIVVSALLAHTGWHWMTDRGAELVLYRFTWPALDLQLLATAMRWLMLVLIVGGVAWILRGAFARFARLPATEPEGVAGRGAPTYP